MPRSLCFDFDGTLVDSRHDIAAAVNRLRSRYDLDDLSVETVTEAIGGGAWVLVDQTVPEDVGESTRSLLEEFRPIYRAICAEKTRAYSGIADLLDEVREDRLAVVTNKPLDMTEKIIRSLRWEDHFDPVYGADSFDRTKPDPVPLEAVTRDWSIEPGDLVMIGDSWTDVKAGNELGCVTVACLYGLGNTEDTLEQSPDHTVETVEELARLIHHELPQKN